MTSSAQHVLTVGSWTEPHPRMPAGPPLALAETGPGPLQLADRHAIELTVELDVIPRLLQGLGRRVNRGSRQEVAASIVEQFARFVLTCDAVAATSFVERVNGKVGVENLLLNLLAPAARHLGDLWTEDLCDFTEVTVGLGRLQQLLRALSPSFLTAANPPPAARRVLLLAFAEEQHTFGLSMVADFFLRAGWNVRSDTASSPGMPARLVRSEWFEVIGFSVGSEARLDALATAIRQVRRASRNPAIGILVGGAIFHDNPSLVSRIGADGTAVDGRSAVAQAQNLATRQLVHG